MSKRKKYPTYDIRITKIAENHFEAEVVKPIVKVTGATGEAALNEAQQAIVTRIYVKDLEKRARKK